MNEDRIGGMADKAVGSVKSAVGDATGDAKLQAEGSAGKLAGTARNALGGAQDAVRDAAEAVSDKASDLGRKAGPALDEAGRKVSEYGREAREVVATGSENVSHLLRGYPLATVGLVAAVGFLLGRLTAPEPRPWYRRDWH
ncbi:CsbD family protein [Paeniroseomonas aquatica]|uniref:CsbD family protein n=1 Tax=Paeniroseomonas aquatica TaxID=373043 RepID=A0ABT8A9D9_9PROT|nr:CsbD family protein [Paeniroseomonas aquatica]MDN3566423.1 CsbD family protein [Paeniroseomonas aquatica]